MRIGSSIAKAARLTLGASFMAAAIVAACTTTAPLVPVASIQLNPPMDSAEVGATHNDWTVTLRDAVGDVIPGQRPMQWMSSNPGVASIDAATGDVTAVGVGEVTITVSTVGKSATAAFRVIPPVLAIVATPDSFDLAVTTSRQIAVQLVGPGGVALSNRAIEWSSSSPNVAVVSTAGQVTAVSTGLTTISIRAGGKTATVRVRVVSEPVMFVRILPLQTVHVIRLSQSKQLTAECLSASQQVLAGRTVTWNSGNPIVAPVTANGLVTGIALGSASITASCENANQTVTVQITPVPVSSVTINPPSMSLTPGSQGQLLATARDSAGNVLALQGRTVQWLTDNQPVASVSNTGVVNGGQLGTANITVLVDGVVSQPVTITVALMDSGSDERSVTSERPGGSQQNSRSNRHLGGR